MHALLWWQWAPAFPVQVAQDAAEACVRLGLHLGPAAPAADADTDAALLVSPFLVFLWEPQITELVAGTSTGRSPKYWLPIIARLQWYRACDGRIEQRNSRLLARLPWPTTRYARALEETAFPVCLALIPSVIPQNTQLRQIGRSELALSVPARRRARFLQRLLALYCSHLDRALAWAAFK